MAEIERLNKKVEKQEKTISELREVAEKTLEIQKCTQKKYSDLNEQIEELQEKNDAADHLRPRICDAGAFVRCQLAAHAVHRAGADAGGAYL